MDLYKPLPPKQIRIFRLDGFGPVNSPSASLQRDILLCGLETISLENVKSNYEDYFALSYCW